MKTLQWQENYLRVIDQTKLPQKTEYFYCYNHEDICDAISFMKVRGAPAIGVSAAFGVVLGAMEKKEKELSEILSHLKAVGDRLIKTRPTAVNLVWAVNRMLYEAGELVANASSPQELIEILEKTAVDMFEDDLIINRAIGRSGQKIVPKKANILTHCNAGALATVGYGTALGVVRAANEDGKKIKVYVGETRPYLQGARLTAWELLQDNIDVTVTVDSAVGYLMQNGYIDLVVVGADRIAKNGDVANKIGTYNIAVIARQHQIPFYVAAPTSTLDLTLDHGKLIPIEERDKEEITTIGSTTIVPEKVNVFNPAFDVTPNELIEGIITEYGIIDKQKMKDIEKWYTNLLGGKE